MSNRHARILVKLTRRGGADRMGGRGCQAHTPGEGVSLPNRYLLFGHQIYPSKNAAECQAPLPNRYLVPAGALAVIVKPTRRVVTQSL